MKLLKTGGLTLLILSGILFLLWKTNIIETKEDRKSRKRTELLIGYYKDKTFILPYYDNDSISLDEFNRLYTAQPIKIVDFLDGDCGVCYDKLTFWEKFRTELSQDNINMPILIYVNSISKELLLPRVNEQWTDPWVYDPDYGFLVQNELFDKKFQTVMLDSANRVLAIGNPHFNEKLRSYFLQTAKDYHQ